MAVGALALDIAFALLAVVLRATLHWRRTGTNPIRGGRGVSGPVALAAMSIVFAAGPVAELTGVLDAADLGPVRGVGLVVMAVGVVTTMWSQAVMGRSWRIGLDPSERTDLVTTGPYRFVRNPIYSSMLALAAGQALAVPNVASLAGALVLFLALEMSVRGVEEPFLREVHGTAYEQYMRDVGRFVPRIF